MNNMDAEASAAFSKWHATTNKASARGDDKRALRKLVASQHEGTWVSVRLQ